MIYNYIKIAIRNLYHEKVYSIINILGLAIGISAFLFIIYFIMDEYEYDRFHKNYQQTYILISPSGPGEPDTWNERMPAPLAAALKEQVPQIEAATHFTAGGDLIISIGDKKYLEKDVHLKTGPKFFDIFHFDFIYGYAGNTLLGSNGVAISKDLAQKYFRTSRAAGQMIRFNNRDWIIEAVFKNLPHHTHLPEMKVISQFDYQKERWYRDWDGVAVPTYVRLREGINPEDVATKISQILNENFPVNEESEQWSNQIALLPVKDIHLQLGPDAAGHRQNILIFSIIGVLILLISCLNFINLNTAHSLQRAKSVAIRKINGSSRLNLIWQFMTEALILGILATGLAILLTEWTEPLFFELTGKNLFFNRFDLVRLILISSGIMVFSGIAAGLYPALLLSAVRPINSLHGYTHPGVRPGKLRRMLVVIQFSISICLLIGSFVVSKQVRFMSQTDPGFNKSSMLILPTQNPAMGSVLAREFEQIKARFNNHPDVLSVTGHLDAPGRVHHQDMYTIEGQGDKPFRMHNVFVDPDFMLTYQIECLSGRGFDSNISTDRGNAFVINQAAALRFGFTKPEQAIGKEISFWGGTGKVIGVTTNFNYSSLHHPVEPLVLHWPKFFVPEMMTIKLKSENLQTTLAEIKAIWTSIYPDNPFDYYFLEDDLLNSYQADRDFEHLMLIFTGLALFIACLGILGLSIYDVQQRTKELCIRKVMGCSLSGIVRLLTIDLTLWIALAGIIAWPAAWILMNAWLLNFAYKTEVSLWIFLVSGLIVLFIALLTVSSQAIKAALANPIDALRYE